MISIIIPVYNVEKYLPKCLDSLIHQTLQEIEIICINDGSRDRSLEILKEYAAKDNRIKIINQKNSGVGLARNVGIEKATGEYIGFIDSDDYVSDDYYEKLYKAALKNNSDIAMTSRVYVVSGTRKRLKNVGANQGIISSIVEKEKVIISTGVIWNKIYNASFLKRIRLQNIKVCSSNEDNYWTVLSIIQANQITVIDNVQYFYVYRPISLGYKEKTEKVFEMIQIYQKIFDTLSNMKMPISEKEQWSNIINARMWADKFTFLRDFSPNLKNKFQQACKGIGHPIIISLTSYPARISTVHKTIESLLDQTIKADKIVLWLAPEQFPNKEKDLPPELLDLTLKGLTINWYHDIKSYKKLIPALKKYPDSLIITVDDDAIYQNNVVERLLKGYIQNPAMIHTLRAHGITFKRKKMSPYRKWVSKMKSAKPSFNNFLTGVGGVLYPPNALHTDVFDENKFMKLAPQADDVWFWGMAVHNGTKINLVSNKGNSCIEIPETQDNALWKSNVTGGKNDQQISAVLKAYPDVLERLDKSARRFSIFGIPILKIKKNQKRTLKKIYLLGLPIWIHHKKEEIR
ncbi:MAG: glycosyltransferase [Alphaproteobacteria bacterium]|nr:glycosyltransferase [Alphaproteobacteria bacterium]